MVMRIVNGKTNHTKLTRSPSVDLSSTPPSMVPDDNQSYQPSSHKPTSISPTVDLSSTLPFMVPSYTPSSQPCQSIYHRIQV